MFSREEEEEEGLEDASKDFSLGGGWTPPRHCERQISRLQITFP